MRPYPLTVIAAMLAFLAAGCRHSESDDLPATVASPEGTVHLERLGEAERVLEQINDQEAWVFKYRGGPLTTEFTVFHRPQGKDQAERVIFRRSGDGVARGHKAKLREAGEDEQQDEDGGYVIAAIPESLDGNGEFTFSFSLNSDFTRSTYPANEIYPRTVAAYRESGGGYMEPPGKVKLSPGESRTLVSSDRRLYPSGTDVPWHELRDTAEQIRYVLTVTALQDGQLPKRDGPAIPE
jgi:hypothetical protein